MASTSASLAPIGMPQIAINGLGLELRRPGQLPAGPHRHDIRVFGFGRAICAALTRSSSAASGGGSITTTSPRTPACSPTRTSRASRPESATRSRSPWAIGRATSSSRPSDSSRRTPSASARQPHARSRSPLRPESGADRGRRSIRPVRCVDEFPGAGWWTRRSRSGVPQQQQRRAARRAHLEPDRDRSDRCSRGVRDRRGSASDERRDASQSANPPLAQPLTFTGNISLSNAAATATAAGLAPSSINPDFNSGRMQTYNVNVERQIGAGLGVMVGYFGSQGDRLRIARNVNQPIKRHHASISEALGVEPDSSGRVVLEHHRSRQPG